MQTTSAGVRYNVLNLLTTVTLKPHFKSTLQLSHMESQMGLTQILTSHGKHTLADIQVRWRVKEQIINILLFGKTWVMKRRRDITFILQL
jgi:hypothetical protein